MLSAYHFGYYCVVESVSGHGLGAVVDTQNSIWSCFVVSGVTVNSLTPSAISFLQFGFNLDNELNALDAYLITESL